MQDETIDIHGQTLLVTGAAGFIGSRVARLLLAAERPPSKVIGLDSLSDYYSPQLKRARLAQLADAALDSDCAWRFVQADIADRAALEAVFADYRPSLVIHLAAQAGVRLTRLTDYGVMEPGSEHERVVLLGFAGMDEAAIEAGLEKLRRAWM